jgi:predicted TIM-barrel fold metal-dependent hydrolase
VTQTRRFVMGQLVDHHCHGLVQRELDRAEFETLLNEGAGATALGTTVFDSMLGLAVRRWCAPVLDLAPRANPTDYLARRRELGMAEVDRRFVSAAGVSDFIVDTGFEPEPVSTPADLAALNGGRGHRVARLESIGQALLTTGVAPEEFGGRLAEELRSSGAVGAKSIAAYRVGLGLSAAKPTEGELVGALRAIEPGAEGGFRIAHPAVNAYLAWTAIEVGLPLQFHVGYGDSDVDLLECDPLRLTGFLRATQEHGIPVVLLHNYPFHRHASYLAQVFDHVFMDVGLSVHNTGALSPAIISESLELVPFGKMLYSSDAFGLSELYYLGALLFRRGLSSVLESLVTDGEMGAADADHLSALVCRDNARRVYALG